MFAATRAGVMARKANGPSARYFRFLCNATNGGASLVLNELQLRGTVGGGNLLSPSSVMATNGDGTVSNLVDGSLSTIWGNSSASGIWARADLGVTTSVAELALYYGTSNLLFSPKDFRIQTSPDATAWTDALVLTGITWTANTWKYFLL